MNAHPKLGGACVHGLPLAEHCGRCVIDTADLPVPAEARVYAQGGVNDGAPVTLAQAGDICSSCPRPLNVNEPLYRAAGGKVICAACHDAAPESATAANVRAFAVELSHLRTSEVLERAAAELLSCAPFEVRHRVSATAAELRNRAAQIRTATNDPYDGHCLSDLNAAEGWAACARAIGEVRR